MSKQRPKTSSLVIQAPDGRQTILPDGYSPPPLVEIPNIPAVGGRKVNKSEQRAMELLAEALEEDGLAGNQTRRLLALMQLRMAFHEPANEREEKLMRERSAAIERTAKIVGAYGPLPPGQERTSSIEDMLNELQEMRQNAAITRG